MTQIYSSQLAVYWRTSTKWECVKEQFLRMTGRPWVTGSKRSIFWKKLLTTTISKIFKSWHLVALALGKMFLTGFSSNNYFRLQTVEWDIFLFTLFECLRKAWKSKAQRFIIIFKTAKRVLFCSFSTAFKIQLQVSSTMWNVHVCNALQYEKRCHVVNRYFFNVF